MIDKKLPNATIVGAGTISGGAYYAVRCSGSVKITNDIRCHSISTSGSASAAGKIECEDVFATSGSMKVAGDVKADTVKCSGALRIDGAVEARKINISGAFRAGKDISAEFVDISGGITVDGLLNAECIDIRLGGQNHVGSIGGGTITIKRGLSVSFFGFFKKRHDILKTSVIEADSVDLEDTIAETVRVINAKIRGGCEIATLEYSGTLDVDPSAKIGNIVKR